MDRVANPHAPPILEDMPTTYYSVKDAAEYLKLSRSRITDLIYEKRFPGARKVGKSWEIPQEDLDSYTYKPMGRPKKERRNRRKTE
jgi:excisionase family DNA binding protein